MTGLTEANSVFNGKFQWNDKNCNQHLIASAPWSLSIFAYLGIPQKQFKASAQINLQITCAPIPLIANNQYLSISNTFSA